MSTTNERFPRDPQYVPAVPVTTRGFWANVRLIRPVAWAIAFIVFVGVECVVWFALIPQKLNDRPHIAWVGVSLAPIIFFLYVLLIGYVYVDAKRRGMRYVMWTLLAIFINNFIGVIIYFLLRDPMPTPCPKCGYSARYGFSFCPNCSAELLRNCRVCHRKLEVGWVACAYCGAPVGAAAQTQS